MIIQFTQGEYSDYRTGDAYVIPDNDPVYVKLLEADRVYGDYRKGLTGDNWWRDPKLLALEADVLTVRNALAKRCHEMASRNPAHRMGFEKLNVTEVWLGGC